MKTFNLLLLFNCLLLIQTANSQGCSDAGFCSLDGIQSLDSHNNSFKNRFTIGTSYGIADHGITIIAPFLSYQRSLIENLSISTKLTSIQQKSEEVENSGLSDFFISANYKISNKTNLTAGTKLPLSNGNEVYNSVYPYPLDFQPSLGTTDIIVGFATNFKKLEINVATQLPVSQGKNTFIAEVYDTSNFFSEFQSTNNYQRKGDLLLRGTYEIEQTEKIRFTSSLLSIYHLGNDIYVDENNIENEIEESNGLTININLFLDYNISQKSSLNLSLGSPIIVRKVRPDGLTRSFITSLSYNYSF
jgi:hypothetical protein